MSQAPRKRYNGCYLEPKRGKLRLVWRAGGTLALRVCLHLDAPNSSTVANGSADHGRKRFSVNFVFCPGVTSTRT